MDRYAKMELTDDDVSPNVRKFCRNEHDGCASFAVQGQCWKDPLYMLAHCSLACQFCDEAEKFQRCASGNGGDGTKIQEVLFHEAGDLNSFFRQAKKSGRWDQYGPDFTSWPGNETNDNDETGAAKKSMPFVVRFDSFLSASESRRIVEIANDVGWLDSEEKEEENFGSNLEKLLARRSSKSAICFVGGGCDSDPVYSAVMNRVADTLGISRTHFEHTEIVKYQQGDLLGPHHDYRIHDLWKPGECCLYFSSF